MLPAERVKHLDGGVFRWFAAGLPMVGEYDASNAGKTPNTAEKPSGGLALGWRWFGWSVAGTLCIRPAGPMQGLCLPST